MSERSSHPSSAQIEALLDFLERNPDLAKGYSKCQHARERSRRQWEELSLTLNSLGGTIKTSKQWTKYWSDKKSAVKKKVAARAAARRKTGGGLDGVVELSEVEERIVALFGGEGFGTGDAHLAIPLFPENNTSVRLPRTLPSDSEELEIVEHLNVPGQTRQTNRRLFDSSDVFNTEQSQSILLNIHQERDFSPPPATLSQTPSPVPMPSPSRRGATVTDAGSSTSRHAQPPTPRLASELISEASSSRRGATSTNTRMVPAGSSTTRSAQPPTPRLWATPASEASPSRRGTTTGSNANISIRSRRSAASTTRTTRHTAPAPPSQRQSEFSRITERFLRVEERQLEIQQSNARILQAMLEQSIERDRALSRAVAAIGEGLQCLAEATKRREFTEAESNMNDHQQYQEGTANEDAEFDEEQEQEMDDHH